MLVVMVALEVMEVITMPLALEIAMEVMETAIICWRITRQLIIPGSTCMHIVVSLCSALAPMQGEDMSSIRMEMGLVLAPRQGILHLSHLVQAHHSSLLQAPTVKFPLALPDIMAHLPL